MSALEAALAEEHAKIGSEVGVSDWVQIDQEMIDQFATVTLDTQWIHTDPERAAQTSFGGTIAHGFLTLSLASQFAYQCLPMCKGQVMGVNYGMNKLRFLSPVVQGARVRGRFVLRDANERAPREMMREVLLTIEIEGHETPALVAEWLTLAIFES